MSTQKVASFPGPAQLWPHPAFCRLQYCKWHTASDILQATESWAGPGNEATQKGHNIIISNTVFSLTMHNLLQNIPRCLIVAGLVISAAAYVFLGPQKFITSP